LQPAVLYFKLHVHVYKGHDFNFPTKITIKGCDNEDNKASNPFKQAEVKTATKTADCECAAPDWTAAMHSKYTDPYTCMNKCKAQNGCMTYVVRKNPHQCFMFKQDCACKAGSPKGIDKYYLIDYNQGWPTKWVITNPLRTEKTSPVDKLFLPWERLAK
jgi:hypothetical protein